MRELTVEKKAGEKQQLTNCGDRSCGLPSNSHPLDLPLGRMSHKHAWRSGSLQHTKPSVLTTEVISLFRPTTPSCCIIPIFYKMLLAHHGAHRIQNQSIPSRRGRASAALCMRTPQEPGKGIGPGFLQFFPSQVRLASPCAVHFINSCIPLSIPYPQH